MGSTSGSGGGVSVSTFSTSSGLGSCTVVVGVVGAMCSTGISTGVSTGVVTAMKRGGCSICVCIICLDFLCFFIDAVLR